MVKFSHPRSVFPYPQGWHVAFGAVLKIKSNQIRCSYNESLCRPRVCYFSIILYIKNKILYIIFEDTFCTTWNNKIRNS